MVYGDDALPITCVEDVDNLIRLKDSERFDRYLLILYLAKLILTSKEAHRAASYHMAKELYEKYNVGMIRLKFTLSRATTSELDQIPGLETLTEEDVVMGLYEGFMQFKQEVPEFDFVLSPCFRKEADFYDSQNFTSKKEHILHQVDQILAMIDKYPELEKYLTDVDTVGNEKDLYRKGQFLIMQQAFRKLHYRGFSIRSHHGETWHTLKKGVQAVDNSLNIWHIDTLEHGLSLGINPNFYYHSLFQRVVTENWYERPVPSGSNDIKELEEMDWNGNDYIKDKLIKGIRLTEEEVTLFVKAKFHTAREVEHYQHDVLNRMINKNVGLIALPSSNSKLTKYFPDFKDHPFSWWEKKGVKLCLVRLHPDNEEQTYEILNVPLLDKEMELLFEEKRHSKTT
jgi:hypothetical protein